MGNLGNYEQGSIFVQNNCNSPARTGRPFSLCVLLLVISEQNCHFVTTLSFVTLVLQYCCDNGFCKCFIHLIKGCTPWSLTIVFNLPQSNLKPSVKVEFDNLLPHCFIWHYLQRSSGQDIHIEIKESTLTDNKR